MFCNSAFTAIQLVFVLLAAEIWAAPGLRLNFWDCVTRDSAPLRSCRSGCRDQTLALYREGLIDYPEWRVASLNCTERWNDGCRFKTDQQERHQCFQACDQLVPEAAKAAHHECWDLSAVTPGFRLTEIVLGDRRSFKSLGP